MTPWLYSIEPSIDGVENMRRDEAMAEACREDGVPRLRLYWWSPWTISLGHNQSDDGVDRDALARAGYGLVRRPTGGRAVFHADELTYAVAMPSSGAGVHETYARISEALRAGLADVGAHVEFERSQPDFRTHYDQEDSESCFSASALNELVWNGRKLVGSAQRRYGPVLLQHGSLLLGDAHLEIIDFLFARADTDRRVAMKRRLASRTTTLREILGGTAPELIDLAMAIVHGFGATFAATFARVDDITLAPNQHESEPSIR